MKEYNSFTVGQLVKKLRKLDPDVILHIEINCKDLQKVLGPYGMLILNESLPRARQVVIDNEFRDIDGCKYATITLQAKIEHL